ncbi:MAG TPA: histidine phosphatase family protein [Streptosporangiaceae bacterium]|nr:histidine phosphatase family protein [Streptosporangiaceae bacterium]
MTQIPSSEQPGSGTYPQRRFEPPPGATEVLLARHGQSQEYVQGSQFSLVDRQGDPPLSPLGHEQAKLLCARLARTRIDAIYVTTLCRTAQTAVPLVRELGLDPTVEPDLREVYLGEWEGGLFRKMVADGHPTALRMFAEGRWDVIPGAEPSAAFGSRVRSALDRLVERHADQRVAVFTHGGVIGQAFAVATGAQRMAFAAADNASISGLVAADGRWVVRGFNDTAHLKVT